MTSVAPHASKGSSAPDVPVDHLEGVDTKQVYATLASLLQAPEAQKYGNTGQIVFEKDGSPVKVTIWNGERKTNDGGPAGSIVVEVLTKTAATATTESLPYRDKWTIHPDGQIQVSSRMYARGARGGSSDSPRVPLKEVMAGVAPSATSAVETTRGVLEKTLES